MEEINKPTEVKTDDVQVVTQPVADPSAQNAVTQTKITIDQLVNICIEKEASDIHFREGGRTALRVGGKIIFIENIETLSKEDTDNMINAMLSDEREIDKLQKNREIDFSYTHKNGVNFRVNVFYQKGKLAGVMRMISKNISSMDDLKLPSILKDFLKLRQGLILICGTAGSGKSTTIQSMLQHINENYVKHILTIENPIEYVFEGKKSIFTQREVGQDTLVESNALRSAMREDANVVMVSDIRDYETLDHTLELVETGHLVIASMSTGDAVQTVERMINLCPHDVQKHAQDRIAENLSAILVQDLIEKKDQSGLIPVFEFMFMTPSIRNIVNAGKLVQLRAAIQSAANDGMITMDGYALGLVQQGLITEEQLAEYTRSEE